MVELLKLMQQIALLHGASLTHPGTMTPLSIDRNAKGGDYSKGVLAALAEIHYLISNTPDGRKSLLDLGFQPFLENVEGK